MKRLLSVLLFGVLFVGAIAAQVAPNPDVSETVLTNTKVTLSVTADGTAPITYTWYKNNVQVATGTSLVFNSIQTTDAGTYKVTASNVAGSSDSNNATLVVIVPVAPSNVKITITKG
jgi:beta-galactosidase